MHFLEQVLPHVVESLFSSVEYPLTTLRKWVSYRRAYSKFARGVLRFRFFPILILMASLAPAFCFANIGAEWNPTGNPIGGGPGYSDTVRHQDADYYVVDRTQLLNALSNACCGDVIYVADSAAIDMGTSQDVFIPGGVALASGRGRTLDDTVSWGGMIYTNRKGGYSLFRVAGKNVRVTGLRFLGEFGNYREGVVPDTFNPGSGLKLFDIWQDSVEIDNCEFCGVGNIAIGDYNDDNTFFHVHHCYFYNTTVCVQGVGCYNGGAGAGTDLFEANLFDYVRQNIAATGCTTTSYEARYNLGLEHGVGHGLDRHGWPTQGDWGGRNTNIHHNTVRNRGWGDRAARIRGTPASSATINNNWFYYSTQDSAVMLWSPVNCVVYDNNYGTTPPPGVEGKIPVAIGQVSTDSGTVPMQVSFSDAGSYDPDGSIAWYEWDFGDNSAIVRHDIATHTFGNIGVYIAELTVHDNDGITDFDTMHIKVCPSSTAQYYVSAWVNDRYCADDTGYFFKQILLDDWVIWESDIAGYHGWEQVVVNVTDSINVWHPESVTISLKVLCKKNMTGQIDIMETWWDDVAFFWGDIQNGDFESGSATSANHWTYSENETWFNGAWDNESCRSGNVGYKIMYYVQYDCASGGFGMIQQRVAVNTLGISNNAGNEANCTFKLNSLYPNPSSERLFANYRLSNAADLSMQIFDVNGRLVRTVIESAQLAGEHTIVWDGKSDRGNDVANGVYFCRFVADDYVETKQIVWLR